MSHNAFRQSPLSLDRRRWFMSYRRAGLTISVVTNLGLVHTAVSQTPTSRRSPNAPQAVATAPVSPLTVTAVVPTGFPDPTHPIDWSRYQTPEDCYVVFERILAVTHYAHRQETFRDTLRDDPWAPLPPAAIQAARQCLTRFQGRTLPPYAWSSTLRLAVAVNADSLARTIVDRQLVAMQDAPVRARAAVLDTVIELLMRNSWQAGDNDMTNHMTAKHVQLARVYAAQLDALGPAAILERIAARDALMRPAEIAHDLDALLGNERDELTLLRQFPLAALLPNERVVGTDTNGKEMSAVQYRTMGLQWDMLRLAYLKTLAPTDLARYVEPRNALYHHFGQRPPDLLGERAPPLQCTHFFATPAATAPLAGLSPAMPVPGTLSLIMFVDESEAVNHWREYALLRHVHQVLPDVAITLVARTHGRFKWHNLLTRPDQEATLLHQYFADSLNVPGAFCATQSTFLKNTDGHAIPLPTPLWEAYRIPDGGLPQLHLFVVDPSGIVVDVDDQLGNMQSLLEWFLQRLQATPPKGLRPRPAGR